MQFRVRVFGSIGTYDFILPMGQFVIGHNPLGDRKLTIPLDFVLDTQLTLAVADETCHASVVTGQGIIHDTRCNDVPLPPDQAVQLHDGDRLSLRNLRDPNHFVTLVVEEIHITPVPVSLPADGDPYAGQVPPGLKCQSIHLLRYLPEIYQPVDPIKLCATCGQGALCEQTPDTFLSRFLAIFESILLPVNWTIANFDFFLNPQTAPKTFLPWLVQWFNFTGDWDERQLRAVIATYIWRGTQHGLHQLIEIYTGYTPQIVDDIADLPHHFLVVLPCSEHDLDPASLKKLIEIFKPAHTTYQVEFAPSALATITPVPSRL